MVSTQPEPPKVPAARLKAAARYMARLRGGEKIMRDACGRLQWASGKPLAPRTVEYLLEQRQICEIDTDLFGDPRHGQTLGLAS
jgi:hypothetical protein